MPEGAPDWSAATGGEVIELHSYFAQREVASCPPEILREHIESEVLRAWPELKGSIVHVECVINERTFDKQTVGHHAFAPPVRTSIPNLTLCGSWPRIDTAVHDMGEIHRHLAANRIPSEFSRLSSRRFRAGQGLILTSPRFGPPAEPSGVG
jgi:hypothetical protein